MQYKNKNYKAAGVANHLDAWIEIGAPPVVLNWIREGVKIPFVEKPTNFCIPNRKFSFEQGVFIATKIKSLLDAGAIEKCSPQQPPKCVSPLNCVPKKGGKLRLISDLRKINNLCTVPKFCYEDVQVVTQIVQTDDQMITLDLKNGFHHIPIVKEDREYLGFYFRGNYYKWAVLPFGLKISPYVFCKTVRQVIKHLRTLDLRLVAYMDDFFLTSTKEKINSHKTVLLKTLRNLGLTVNWEKSSLDPEMTKEFIGYKVCTAGIPTLKIPNARIKKLKKTIIRVLNLVGVRARVLARIAGQCIAMAKAILPGKLLLRNVYRLLATKKSWDQELILDAATRTDLEWWNQAVKSWNGMVGASRHTTRDRCVPDSLECNMPRTRSCGVLELQNVNDAIELQRDDGNITGIEILQKLGQQKSPSTHRQYSGSSICQPSWRSKQTALPIGKRDMDGSLRKTNNITSEIFARSTEYNSGHFVAVCSVGLRPNTVATMLNARTTVRSVGVAYAALIAYFGLHHRAFHKSVVSHATRIVIVDRRILQFLLGVSRLCFIT